MIYRVVMMVVCVAGAAMASARPTTGPGGEAGEILQTNRVHTIDIQITRDRWQTMQPMWGSRLAVLLGVPQHPVPEAEGDGPGDESTRPAEQSKGIEGKRVSPSAFGYEFAYVRATVEFDGEVMGDVGIRFKGNYSFRNSGNSYRRPYKLDFNRFVPGRKFHGLETVNLHNNTADPSQVREALSYLMFREAGVPSPRTAFAMVYLSIEGVCGREFIGLYTLTEEVDKRYLKEHFGNATGLLLKPEQTRDMPYLGDDWDEYVRYRPKTRATEHTSRRFIEFTELIHFADDETFREKIDSFIDTDEFIRFVAVNVLVIDMDGFLSSPHNYFMYVNPEDERIHFMPWDMHLTFAAGGGQGGLASMSIDQSFPANRLLERVLQRKDLREKYHAYLREYSRTWFSPAEMNRRIEEMNRVVRLADARFAELGKVNSPTTMPVSMPRKPDLKAFVKARTESVMGQLEGRGASNTPGRAQPTTRAKQVGNRAGANRRAAQTPRPNQLERQEIDVRDAQQLGAILLNNLDADRNGQLVEQELVDSVDLFLLAIKCRRDEAIGEKELAEGLDRVGRLLDSNMVRAAAAKSAAERNASSGGEYWARVLMKAGDGDRDGRLSRDELIGLMKRALAADRNRDRSLDRNEVVAAVESLAGKRPATTRPAGGSEPSLGAMLRQLLGR